MVNRLGNKTLVVSLLAMVVVVVGGAAMPPETPINDMKSIAGIWKGTFTTGKGSSSPITLTITEAGEYNAVRPEGSSSGGVILKDGKGVTSRGTVYTLYAGDGKRVLVIEAPDGGKGELTETK